MKDNSTVFVVDDDAAIRESLRWVMESAGMQVQVFGSAREFLAAYDPSRPDCLVLDVRMPGQSGLSLQQDLVKRDVTLPILFISAHGTVPDAVRAMKRGAVDFLMKPFNNEDLLERVAHCLELGRQACTEAARRGVVAQRLALLTPRECEVMEHVVDGKSSKEIAKALKVSAKTVDVHRAQIMRKMRARSTPDLLRAVLLHSPPKKNQTR